MTRGRSFFLITDTGRSEQRIAMHILRYYRWCKKTIVIYSYSTCVDSFFAMYLVVWILGIVGGTIFLVKHEAMIFSGITTIYFSFVYHYKLNWKENLNNNGSWLVRKKRLKTCDISRSMTKKMKHLWYY